MKISETKGQAIFYVMLTCHVFMLAFLIVQKFLKTKI